MPMDTDHFSLHFLCVGVDPGFLTALLEQSDFYDIALDTCKTSDEVHNKMEHNTYDAYVIDVHISESATVDLIQEIRQKVKHKFVIAVITGSYIEEAKFTVLKENGVIDCLFQKPIRPQQIEILIHAVTEHFAPAPTAGSEKLDALRRKYENSIPEKLELLTMLFTASQLSPDEVHLNELKDALHKIGGSAGSYGFKKVSTLCKEMDTQIAERMATRNVADKEWISSFPSYLKKIEEAFKTSAKPQSTLKTPEMKERTSPVLYVVGHDKKLLEALELEKTEYPLDLIVESDPKKGLERLKNIDFNPDAIVVEQSFPSSAINAFDFIRLQRQKFSAKQSLFALILEQENIDTRIEAMQKGVSYIFRKPVYADVLLQTISDSLDLNARENFKVLVLDDDIDFCNFVTIALSEIGVAIKTITNSTDLFKTLEQYQPQLLLLDLVLPKYDGLNLLKSIRQDVAYQKLFVVIVTSSEEPLTRLSAYSAKADDILYKPLDIAVLQKRIQNIAERYKSTAERHHGGDQSGLTNLKTLITKLNNCLTKPGHNTQSLVIFEINNFTDTLMKMGHSSLNDLLAYINRQIAVEYEPFMHNFSYNLSKFALIFDEKDPAIIERKMFEFLTNLSKNSPHGEITFNCCIVPISKKFGNADQILHIADECLNEVNKREPAPVRIFLLTTENAAPTKKEVVLVDGDEELLKILKTAFEAHGISVRTYTNGDTALKEILEKNADALPALTIVERKLIDMDGLDLIIKINDHFDTSIPFYVLSIFSSDKDVSEGLKQGALEYIGKPFNLSILMQKALKTILKD